MRTLFVLAMYIALSQFAQAQAPVIVMECQDEGADWLRDKCPPGATKKREIELRGLGGIDKTTIEAIANENPITLYSIPDCDACDLTRNALQTRNIPFTEIDVQDNAERQDALRALTGNLSVPALSVGKQILNGYSRDAIDGALAGAGYPLDGSASDMPAANTKSTSDPADTADDEFTDNGNGAEDVDADADDTVDAATDIIAGSQETEAPPQ